MNGTYEPCIVTSNSNVSEPAEFEAMSLNPLFLNLTSLVFHISLLFPTSTEAPFGLVNRSIDIGSVPYNSFYNSKINLFLNIIIFMIYEPYQQFIIM